MKLRTRIFFLTVFAFFLLLSAEISYAEEDTNAKEVTVEAIYQMGEADTPAKAEEQALMRAKRNALEQVSSLTLTMEDIAALPSEVFAVIVLDKKRALNGNTMECWVKIKAVVRPDKLETALKDANGGRPAEYYEETILYDNGNQVGEVTKIWYKKDWMRTETVNVGIPGTTIYIFKTDKADKRKGTGWFISGNKYFEQPPVDPKELEKYMDPSNKADIKVEILGTETIGTIVAQKKRVTIASSTGSKLVTTEWIDPATNLPLKQHTDGGVGGNFMTVHQNRRIGPQDPALFEIPSGYIRCAKMEDLYMDAFAASQPAAPSSDPFSNLFDSILQNQVDKAFDKLKIK